MSELINRKEIRGEAIQRLLATASVLALLASTVSKAVAEEADRPTVWIELGGQVERQTGQGDTYAQPFLSNYASSAVFHPVSPFDVQKPPRLSKGAEGVISLQPEGSDWVFSASVRYGRANKKKSVHHNTAGEAVHYGFFNGYTSDGGYSYITGTFVPGMVNYANTDVTHRGTHTILNFKAGKDVGLGLFGRASQNVVSLGVRFAQFTTKSSAVLHAKPDNIHYNGFRYYNYSGVPYNHQSGFPNFYLPTTHFHAFGATSWSSRNFHGIGPSISWDSSVAVIGSGQSGEVTLDFGINGALLFGRRKAEGAHHESGHYHRPHFFPNRDFAYYSNNATFDRREAAAVPNVGGFAGISFRFLNAKLSLGYRGDFFIGAMDAGIDQDRRETVGLYGPFAAISIGLGG